MQALQRRRAASKIYQRCQKRQRSSLADFIPDLKQRFAENTDPDGVFPLMTAKQKGYYKKEVDEHTLRKQKAAVLLGVVEVDGAPNVLFTKRSPHLSQHSGEISFPGGHFDQGSDQNLLDTAIRETHEELVPHSSFSFGSDVEVIGETSSLPSISGIPVTTFLGIFRNPISSSELASIFPGDGNEVDVVFSVPVEHLASQETSHELPKNRFGMQMAPKFPTDQGDIWGLTALILRPILRDLLVPTFKNY